MNKPISKRLKKLKLQSEPKELLLEIFTMLIAFAITPIKFLFDIYPFGLALCASTRRRAPFALAGSALSFVLFVDKPVPYVIALLALVGMRLAGSVWLHDNGERELSLGKSSRPSFVSLIFMERASVRVALCALCALGLGVWRVIASAYSYYEIFVLIFFCVLASVLCYALCSLDEGGSNRLLGICALLFIFIYAIRGKEIFGLDISMVLSYASILYASKYISGAKSCALGALLGICHGPLFAPVFAICAITSSFLWSFSYYLAIISALVMSVGYGVFASGYQALVYLLPELLLASLAMYPITRFEILPRADRLLGIKSSSPKVVSTTDASREATLEMSRTFSEISELLSELSQKGKSPDREFYKSASLEICESHCFSCPKRTICWEKEILTTKDNIARMGEGVFVNGSPSVDSLDERFLHRCPNIELIFDELSAFKESCDKRLFATDKFEISAQDYALMSRLIDEIFLSIDKDSRPNPLLYDKVVRACDRIGLRYGFCTVTGTENVKITLGEVDSEASKCSLNDLKIALEDALDIPLDAPVLCEDEDTSKITTKRAKSLAIVSESAFLSEDEKEQNGDTVCEIFSSDDKYYSLLCDGMGTGAEAHATSQMCAEFMRKLLPVCKSKELAMCMLNNFVRAKALESSSSVDLLEIDLLNGSACLVKSGAAPSFIKRGTSVFRLHSRTAPIGIMRELDAEKLDFSLREGDIIVMISDGIASDERDSKYLVDFLSSVEVVENDEIIDTLPLDNIKKEVLAPANSTGAIKSSEPLERAPKRIPFASLADAIIKLAKQRVASCDDMSVSVIKITNAYTSESEYQGSKRENAI